MTIAERVLTAKPGDQVVMEAYINHLNQIAGKWDSQTWCHVWTEYLGCLKCWLLCRSRTMWYKMFVVTLLNVIVEAIILSHWLIIPTRSFDLISFYTIHFFSFSVWQAPQMHSRNLFELLTSLDIESDGAAGVRCTAKDLMNRVFHSPWQCALCPVLTVIYVTGW